MKNLLYLLLILTIPTPSYSAEGTISGKIFFDYSFDQHQNNAFELRRAYFNYKTDLSESIRFTLKLDAGRENLLQPDASLEKSRLYAYLKNAKAEWQTGFGTFILGIQGLNIFNVQEMNWGYRFVEKSALDLHKWSSSADLGAGFSRSSGNFHASILVTNGTGYKHPENNRYKKFSLQLFHGQKKLSVAKNHNFGIITVYEKIDSSHTRNYFGLFGAYSTDQLIFGGESNFAESGNLYSVYGRYFFADQLSLYGRLDYLEEIEDTYSIIGVNYSPESGFNISPNIRWTKDGFEELRVNFIIIY